MPATGERSIQTILCLLCFPPLFTTYKRCGAETMKRSSHETKKPIQQPKVTNHPVYRRVCHTSSLYLTRDQGIRLRFHEFRDMQSNSKRAYLHLQMNCVYTDTCKSTCAPSRHATCGRLWSLEAKCDEASVETVPIWMLPFISSLGHTRRVRGTQCHGLGIHGVTKEDLAL